MIRAMHMMMMINFVNEIFSVMHTMKNDLTSEMDICHLGKSKRPWFLLPAKTISISIYSLVRCIPLNTYFRGMLSERRNERRTSQTNFKLRIYLKYLICGWFSDYKTHFTVRLYTKHIMVLPGSLLFGQMWFLWNNPKASDVTTLSKSNKLPSNDIPMY